MMKCPYCAEEIQDAAVICKYCRKKVRRNPYRAFILAIIIISIVIYAHTHRTEIFRTYRNVKVLLGEFCSTLRTFAEAIRELPESMRALNEYHKKVTEVDDIVSDS